MTEMNAVARFFVNSSSGRRAGRRFTWLSSSAALPTGDYLELGCGNGEFAARVVDGVHPKRYVATDFDERQVEAARKALSRHYPTGLPANLELRTADMLKLPFPDGSFDVVSAFLVLHHAGHQHRDFTKVREALDEVQRVLRPGGLFAYEEFLHQERLRVWLAQHRFPLVAMRKRVRTEIVVARKPSAGA